MFRIYRICAVCIVLLNYLGNTEISRRLWGGKSPFRLLDYWAKDLFFDRIVFFMLDVPDDVFGRSFKVIAPGVLIENNRVLTSFNPFRNLTKTEELLEKIYVFYLKARTVHSDEDLTYDCEHSTIVCGRPLVPMSDEELTEDQWHGYDKEHSPLHDLMVVRLDTHLDIWEPEIEDTYEQRHNPEVMQNNAQKRAGPLITKLCARNDKLTSRIQFVALGLNYRDRYNLLELAEYENSDNPIVDCDEWLPRSWGYFICLVNNERFNGFGSGAMLFSERKLFGVGSFTLWRGDQSILVFTDIRPYLDHINHTCVESEF